MNVFGIFFVTMCLVPGLIGVAWIVHDWWVTARTYIHGKKSQRSHVQRSHVRITHDDWPYDWQKHPDL